MKKVAVVMAGGGGLRLWPLSSPERPKHMLRLFSDASLLKETVDRITTLAEMDNVWIVLIGNLCGMWCKRQASLWTEYCRSH
jgi:mannose-1-phosphate guanylyltransferase